MRHRCCECIYKRFLQKAGPLAVILVAIEACLLLLLLSIYDYRNQSFVLYRNFTEVRSLFLIFTSLYPVQTSSGLLIVTFHGANGK